MKATSQQKIRVQPIFQDWVHTTAVVFSNEPVYNKSQVQNTFPKLTTTSNCIVAITLPHISLPQSQNQPFSSIHFWQDISDDSSDNSTEIIESVTTQYNQIFPRLYVHPRLNPPVTWISQFFAKAKNRPKNQRILIHYYAHQIPSIENNDLWLFGNDGRSFEGVPVENIVNESLPSSAFIFECDNSGLFLPVFQKLPPDTDTFAFFACGPNQKLPHASGLPIDLFTSCMTTPSRMALLWHSRHYYCFKNGPLKPLSPFFLEENESDSPCEEIFSNIQSVLRDTVEAMAFQTMDRATFLRFFRKDHVTTQLAVYFAFATRIMNFFNITPLSYPSMPSFANHQLWRTFDLRLDAELFRLQQPQLPQSVSYSHYLEQVIISLNTAVEVSSPNVSFFPQISFISSILSSNEKKLIGQTCDTLAMFLDRNPEAVESILYFPITQQLYRLLKMQYQSQSLIFCIAKIICYHPGVRDLVLEKGTEGEFFPNIILPLLKNPVPTISLILIVLFIKDNAKMLDLFMNSKWLPYVMPLLKINDNSVKIWTLLLISNCVSKITNEKLLSKLLEELKLLQSNQNVEVRIALLYCLSNMTIQFSSEMHNTIFDYILEQKNQNSHLIRCQILSTISYFFAQNPKCFYIPENEIQKKAHDALIEFSSDPHPIVNQTANSIIEAISVKTDIQRKSLLLDSYCALILSNISHIIADPSLPLVLEKSVSSKRERSPINTIQPRSNKKFKALMKIGNHYIHKHNISSNFVLLPQNQMMFGDSSGTVVVKNWNDNVEASMKFFKIMDHDVRYIRYLYNNAYPLLFASDIQGTCKFLTARFDNISQTKLLSASRNQFPNQDSKTIYDFDEIYGRLFAYEPNESTDLSMYDLRSELPIGNISFENKIVRSAKYVDSGSNLIGVCTDEFLLIDQRSRDTVRVVETQSSPIDFKVIDPTAPSFLIGQEKGVIDFFDIRNLTGTRTIYDAKVDFLSFDAHLSTLYTGIGYSNGIVIADIINRRDFRVKNFPGLFGSGQPLGRISQCLFHQATLSMNVLNGQNEIVLLQETADE